MSAERKVGIGLIGCGHRLRGVVKATLGVSDNLRVTAVCDIDPDAIERTKQTVAPDARVYSDVDQMVQDKNVDWVMIGSPNSMHREHAVAAMEAGKDVFCEKPLATKLEDCIAMRDAHKRTGRKFFIGFTLRYSPHYTKLLEVLQSGAIGEVISIEMNETLHPNHGAFMHQDWRRFREYSGSFMLEKCCHDIDIAHWLTGSLATRAASFGGRNFFVPENSKHIERIGPHPETGNQYYRCFNRQANLKNPFTIEQDVVDNQVSILEYANQMRLTFFLNCNAAQNQRRSYICGTEGTIDADATAHKIKVKRIGWDEPTVVYDTTSTGGHGGSDPLMTGSLAQCMLGNVEPRAGLDEGFNSAVTCFAIDEALQTGQVVDLRPKWQQLGIEIDQAEAAAAR